MIEFYRWETRGTRYELMFIRVEHPDAARKGWLIAGPWGWGEVNISHVGFIGDCGPFFRGQQGETFTLATVPDRHLLNSFRPHCLPTRPSST